MEINSKNNVISVHGREALNMPYSRWTDCDARVQIDISGSTMWIEVPAANIRKQLLPNLHDRKSLVISLARADVVLLPTVQSPFIILDETDPENPVVELEGKIFRRGYTSVPTPPPPPLP